MKAHAAGQGVGDIMHLLVARVHLTGGNWSGSGLGRYQTGPNSKFKFEFKKMKNSQKKFLKILQGATNLIVSNFLKNSSI